MRPRRCVRIWDVPLENSAVAIFYVFLKLKFAIITTTVKMDLMKNLPFAPHKDFAVLISSDAGVVIALIKQ